MGRRPLPTAILKSRGSRKVANRGDEPQSKRLKTIPIPPEHLGETGRAKWMETGKKLIALGILEVRYLDALEAYCAAYEELRECERVIVEQGAYFVAESGYIGQHPAVNRAHKARELIRRYQIEFGLTPSASANVKTMTPKVAGIRVRKR